MNENWSIEGERETEGGHARIVVRVDSDVDRGDIRKEVDGFLHGFLDRPHIKRERWGPSGKMAGFFPTRITVNEPKIAKMRFRKPGPGTVKVGEYYVFGQEDDGEQG